MSTDHSSSVFPLSHKPHSLRPAIRITPRSVPSRTISARRAVPKTPTPSPLATSHVPLFLFRPPHTSTPVCAASHTSSLLVALSHSAPGRYPRPLPCLRRL